MRAQTILALALFLTVRAAAQEPKRPTQAQCKLSGGETITVISSSERTRIFKLITNASLITIKGIDVPAGEYTVFPSRDSENNWTLTMSKQTGNGESSALPPLPMSVKSSTLPAGAFPVSFEQTGGSCMMHWSPDKSEVLLSLEFTVKNTDLPLIQ